MKTLQTLSAGLGLACVLLPARLSAQQPASTETPGTAVTTTNAPASAPDPHGLLRLNFRNAPLELVLNYLSEAAGYIIVLETEVKGKLDVWSNQPVTQAEAFTVLDAALSRNGYTALRDGRTLTIISKDNAKRREIPVKSGNDPLNIPKNEEVVTQIIPVRYIAAAQLTQNLSSLLPTGAELTANEAGNSLVITGTQSGIRRITEIVRALDTSSAGATSIRVFALNYADAKQLATLIKDLFPNTNTGGGGSTGGGGGFNPFAGRGGFGGGGGGFPGGGRSGGGAGGTAASAANPRAAASRVNAVADEHSNSVVVNAPEDVMPEIENLITRVDRDVEDVTELRAFRLKYSDPVEMASLLESLFPDETSTQSNTGRSAVRFGGGGGFGGGFGGGGGGANTASALSRKRGKVIAVPDQRTSSVIVKAAKDLMGQIGQMVQQLDADPSRKQKVFVYELDNAEPTEVEQVLRSLFENQQSQNRTTRNNQNQSSALNTRANQQQQNNNRGGNTGFGGGQGGGGGLGQGGGR